jgi:hypothetical protein
MAAVDGRVFVAVQRLDRGGGWAPAPPSYLAIVDSQTDRLIGDLTLATANPAGPLHVIPGTKDLLVPTAGDWDGDGAGLERVDTDNETTELVLSAAELGGVVAGLTLDGQGCGFAVIMEPGTYENALVRFCLDEGPSSVQTCLPMGEHTFTDVVLSDDGRLFLTDTRHTDPGVRILDPDTCEELTAEPIPTGFSPGFTNPLLLIPRL